MDCASIWTRGNVKGETLNHGLGARSFVRQLGLAAKYEATGGFEMKKILILLVLSTFSLSLPIFGSARGPVTPAAEMTPLANATSLPARAQPGFRRRRFRGARRITVRRHNRGAYRWPRRRYIRRYRRH